jgi:hypothetical protein
VLRLAVLRLAVLRLAVLRPAVLRPAVLRLAALSRSCDTLLVLYVQDLSNFSNVPLDCQSSLFGGHVGVPQIRTWACELNNEMRTEQ